MPSPSRPSATSPPQPTRRPRKVRARLTRCPLVLTDSIDRSLRCVCAGELHTHLASLIDVNHHLLNAVGVGHPQLDKIRLLSAQYKVRSSPVEPSRGCSLFFYDAGGC